MTSEAMQSWVLRSHPVSASEARRHIERACAGLPEDTVYTARLLVTELVSNAVLHGRGAVVLTVRRHPATVRIEVHDDSSQMPVIIDRLTLSEHGAGLRLVADLANEWGVESHLGGRPGKGVWFTLTSP